MQSYRRVSSVDPDELLGMVASSDYSGSSPLIAVSKTALAHGVRPGMTVAQGRLRGAELRIIERSRRADEETRKSLVQILAGFSPAFELGDGDDLGWAYLDLRGLERLFGSYESLCRELLHTLGEEGLEAQCGVTLTRALARVITLGGGGVYQGLHEALMALAEMPLKVLEPSDALEATWGRFGIQTVREFLALPIESVAEHMGEEALLLYRLAMGEETESGVLVREEEERFRAEAYFEDSLQSVEQVMACLEELMGCLIDQMTTRGYFCEGLELLLSYDGQGSHRCQVGVGEPTRHLGTLLELCKLNLEASPPGDSVGFVRVEADAVEVEPVQLSLFGTGPGVGSELGVTLAQLRALCGEGQVGRPNLKDSHEEDDFEISEFGRRPRRDQGQARRSLTVGLRRYRPPLPLRVRVVGLYPRVVIGKGFGGRVVACHGPFRTHGQWWHPRREEHNEDILRDIYDVRLASGVMYRLAHCYPRDTWWALGWYD